MSAMLHIGGGAGGAGTGGTSVFGLGFGRGMAVPTMGSGASSGTGGGNGTGGGTGPVGQKRRVRKQARAKSTTSSSGPSVGVDALSDEELTASTTESYMSDSDGGERGEFDDKRYDDEDDDHKSEGDDDDEDDDDDEEEEEELEELEGEEEEESDGDGNGGGDGEWRGALDVDDGNDDIVFEVEWYKDEEEEEERQAALFEAQCEELRHFDVRSFVAGRNGNNSSDGDSDSDMIGDESGTNTARVGGHHDDSDDNDDNDGDEDSDGGGGWGDAAATAAMSPLVQAFAAHAVGIDGGSALDTLHLRNGCVHRGEPLTAAQLTQLPMASGVIAALVEHYLKLRDIQSVVSKCQKRGPAWLSGCLVWLLVFVAWLHAVDALPVTLCVWWGGLSLGLLRRPSAAYVKHFTAKSSRSER